MLAFKPLKSEREKAMFINKALLRFSKEFEGSVTGTGTDITAGSKSKSLYNNIYSNLLGGPSLQY